LLAVIYAAGFNGQWRPGPDSSIHLQTAKSLAEGHGFTHPTGLEKTIKPGLAYLTAITFVLGAPDNFVLINAVMLLCAAGALTLVFWFIRLRFDRPTAVIVVCMLAVNETFYRYGYQVLTDMPFLSGLALMLLGNELFSREGRQRWAGVALIAVSLLIMGVMRSVVLTVVAAGGLLVVYRVVRGPVRGPYAVVTALGIVVLATVFYQAPHMEGGWLLMRDEGRAMGLFSEQPILDTLHRVFIENGPEILTEHLPEAIFGVDFGPIINTPLGLVAVLIGVSLFKVRPMWGLLFVVFLAQWLLFITTERYMLVVMPFMAVGWWRLGPWFEKRAKPQAAKWALVGLLVLWFTPNLARVGAFITQQRSKPFLEHYEGGRYAGLTVVADELKSLAQDGDIIIADHAPQLTWYTGLAVHGAGALPTYGPFRKHTVRMLRDMQRILVIYPVDAALVERLEKLKIEKLSVLKIIPTPDYEDRPEHRIIQVYKPVTPWEKYKRSLELSRDPAFGTPGPAEHGQDQPDKETDQREQPDDQPG